MLSIGQFGGRGVLKVGRGSDGKLSRLGVVQAPGHWQDFAMEVEARRVSGSWVGVKFRGVYDLVLDEQNRLVFRREYQVLDMTLPLPINHSAFTHFKVVAMGRKIRAYINGVRYIDVHDAPVSGGGCGLLTHEAETEFAAFSITDEPSIDEAVTVAATPTDGALIYSPGAPIDVPVTLDNQSSATYRTTVRATLAPATASDDLGARVEGLAAEYLLLAKQVGTDVELRVDGDDPFTRSRISYRYVLHERAWPSLYMQARIRRTAGMGAGFVFANSPDGQSELYFDDRDRLVMRRIAKGWKDTQVLAVSTSVYPATREHVLELIADERGVVASVNGTEALAVRESPAFAGAAGLLFNRSGAAIRGLMMATSKADTANAWRPKLVEVPPKAIENARAVVVPPGQTKVTLRLPPGNEGYRVLTLTLGDSESKTTYPLGVWKIDPQWAKSRRSDIPLIVFGKYNWSHDAVSADTYLHAVCWTLRKYGLTGALHEFTDARQLEIAKRYGIEPALRDTMTSWAPAAEPSIIVVGDEPSLDGVPGYRERYDKAAVERPKATLLTCMVGESTGKGTPQDPLMVWEALKPAQRSLRHYPIRKASFDSLNPNPDQAPFLGTLERVAAIETPWWFVVQTFGSEATAVRPAPFWRDPTGNELQAMCHLALAHGAKGLFFYTLQTEGNWMALAYPRSLVPCDDKLAALSEVAAFVREAGPVLVAASQSTLPIKAAAASVISRALSAGNTSYAYVVNGDSKQAQKTVVNVGKRFARVTDQVTGKSLVSASQGDTTTFEIEIPAGRAVLLRLE